GNARRATRDFADAAADYTRAIKLNPRYSSAYCNRGVLRKAQGDLDGAIADFDRAIESAPQLVEAYLSRGLILLLLERDVEAERDFARCQSLNKDLGPTLEKRIEEAKLRRVAWRSNQFE